MRIVTTIILCVSACVIFFSEILLCNDTVFYYQYFNADKSYQNESSQINAQLRDELGSLVTLVSDESEAGLSVSGTVTITKQKSKQQLGDDDGKQFLSRKVETYTITVKTYVTKAEDGSHLRTLTSTFKDTEQKVAIRDLAVKIAGIGLPDSTVTSDASEDKIRVPKQVSAFDYGFYSPSAELSVLYLYPLASYADTIEYGLGTSITAAVKNYRLWDTRFALESSFVYLFEQRLAAEDFNLIRLTGLVGLPVYKTGIYTSLISVGYGYHFHFGDRLYKQPHVAVQLANSFMIDEHISAGFTPGFYSFSSETEISYYLNCTIEIEYTF